MGDKIIDALVQDVFARARAYGNDPVNRRKLFPANLTPAQHQEIETALMQDYASNPKIRNAITEILQGCVNAQTLAAAGRNGMHTYLSGPIGAKQMLLASGNAEINADLQTGLQFDFQKAKQLFTEKTGESLDGYKYNKFRALFAGMDQAIGAYANENNIDRVYDNTIPIPPAGVDPKNIHVFAVALQLRQTHKNARSLHIPPSEANLSVERFAKYFTEAQSASYDITVYDADMTPIFVRKNGQVTAKDDIALAYWKAVASPSTPDVYLPTQNPRQEPIKANRR